MDENKDWSAIPTDLIVYDDETGEVLFRGTLNQCIDYLSERPTDRFLKINRPGFALQDD